MILKENSFINKKVRRFFSAAFWGWVISLLGGMGDSLIAGANIDADAVAAIELVTPIYNFIYFVSLLISAGTAIMYSKELGGFNVERSQKLAGMGLLVSFGMGVVLSGTMFFAKDAIIGFYECSEKIASYASEYFNAYILIALIYPTLWLLYALIDHDGDEIIIFFVDISYSIVNIAVSLLLVDSMGVKGLAIGTLVAECCGILILIPHFFKKSNSIHFKWWFSFKDLGEMLWFSTSSSSAILYIALIDIIFNKFIINRFSEDYLPAYTVVNAVLDFAQVLCCAINSGSVFVAIAYGEKNPFEIRRVMKIVHKIGLYISVIFGGILVLIAPYWPELYGITDPEIARAAINAGRIIPLTFIAASFVYNYLSYYANIEKPVEGNTLSIGYMLIGPVVLAIPLSYIWGFTGLIIGFALTPIFAVMLLYLLVVLKKQTNKFPLLLDDTDEIEAHFDIALDTESIIVLRDKVGEFLESNNVDSKQVNEIKLILEDSLDHIKSKNTKKTLCQCVVLLNDKHIRVFTKDNGIVFDMLKEADSARDLQCYVLGRVMEKASEKSYTTTVSFNRNVYVWER